MVDYLFKDFEYCEDKFVKLVYPHFKVRVAAIQKRSPRHPNFEFFLDLGKDLYEKILYDKPLRHADLVMVFPERWLAPIELNQLMNKLHHHSQSKTGLIKTVSIVTSSAFLLTDFPASCVKVFTFPDDPGFKEEE